MEKWCTYSWLNKKFPQSIGKLVRQEGNTGHIRYAEHQMYPLQLWDMNYVEVFDNIEDAIKFLLKNKPDTYLHEVRESFCFSDKVNWEKLEKEK